MQIPSLTLRVTDILNRRRHNKAQDWAIRPDPFLASALTARFLGNETGAVSLFMEGVTLDFPIVQWSPTSTTFVVPNVVISPSASGKILVQRADGNLDKVAAVQLLAKTDLAQVLPSAGATPEQLTSDVAPVAETVIAEME
jgi:hypothetical protein